MSTTMVVMVLKLMMMVAKVLRLHLPPLQVHLQPLFSPSRGFLDNTFFHGTLKREALPGELCCSDGGASTLLSPAASGVANIRSTGLTSPSRPMRELDAGSCRSVSQSQLAEQLLLCGGLENALPAQVVFHHQPSHGFHPSLLPACIADPAFALFSSGWLTLWPSSLTGHLKPG